MADLDDLSLSPSISGDERAPAGFIPKLAVPLRLEGNGLAAVDQDSEDEIAACCYAVLATERGSRLEEPDYGISDPTFEQGGMDLGEAALALRTWEPRAEAKTEQEIEDLTARVTVEVAPA